MRSRLRSVTLFAGALAVLVAGCRKSEAPLQQAPIVDGTLSANDPANANLPPVEDIGGYDGAQPAFQGSAQRGGNLAGAARTAQRRYTAGPDLGLGPRPNLHTASRTSVAGSSAAPGPQAGGEAYGPAAHLQSAGSRTAIQSDGRNEAYRSAAQATAPGNGDTARGPSEGDVDDGYAALLDASVPEAQQPPPPLPAYDQPEAPAQDYLWTPGYWNYAPAGYFYVPGAWVAPPFAGALWTPGWWGARGSGYRWHHGLWSRHVGYYGGINYGFGYVGYGYQGGYWNDNHFLYNRACNHVDTRIIGNSYIRDVAVGNSAYLNKTRISYAGGRGGIERRPAPQELEARREPSVQPMRTQVEQRQLAAQNRGQFFDANHGRPQLVTVSRPLQADYVFPVMGAGLNRPALTRGAGSAQVGPTGSLQEQQSLDGGRQLVLQPAGRDGRMGRQDQQGLQGLQQLPQGGFGVVPVQGGVIGQEQRGGIGLEGRGSVGNEPRGNIGQEPRGPIGNEPRATIGLEPRGNIGNEPRSTIGLEQRGNVGNEPRSTIGMEPRSNIGTEQRSNIGTEQRGNIGVEQRSNIGTEQRGNAGNVPRGAIGAEQRGGVGLEQRHGSAAVPLSPQHQQIFDQQRQQQAQQQMQQQRGFESRQPVQPREQIQPLPQRQMQPSMQAQPPMQQGRPMQPQPSMQPQRAPMQPQQAPRAETARPAGGAPGSSPTGAPGGEGRPR